MSETPRKILDGEVVPGKVMEIEGKNAIVWLSVCLNHSGSKTPEAHYQKLQTAHPLLRLQ